MLALLDDYSHLFESLLPAECDFITITWRHVVDERGNLKHGYGRPQGAFSAVHRLFRDLRIQSPTLWAAERPKWAGEAVHLHGLSRRLTPLENEGVFRLSLQRFGRTQIRAASPGAFPYVCKYLFKNDSCGRHDWLDLSGLHR